MKRCAHCQEKLERRPREEGGRPQRFCSTACRSAGWRRRRAGLPEWKPNLRDDTWATRQGLAAFRQTARPRPQARRSPLR